MEWNERIIEINKIKDYITEHVEVFASNNTLQFLYGSLNRCLLDLNEKEIDNIVAKINKELYD